MMIYFHKLLPTIVSPLGMVIFILIAGLAFKNYRSIIIAIFLLVFSSLPLTSHVIWHTLESSNPPKKYEAISYHQAVVVLSGGVTTKVINDDIIVDWSDPDRFFAGLNAVQYKKADKVIFTRGKMPWSASMPEGEVLKKAAMDFGIPPEKILLTKIVSNTAEEAKAVKSVMQLEGIGSILLITSSFHMPRAELLFRQQNIELETFPVDFKALGKRISWLDFFPSASGFNQTSKGIREYIGRAYYSLRFAL